MVAELPAEKHGDARAPDEPPVPVLSPLIRSVADLWDACPSMDRECVCVARCARGSEYKLVRHLIATGVPYYLPVERVEKWYETGKRRERRTWVRCLLPGFVTVGGGWEGREILNAYRGRHRSQVFPYLPVSAGLQRLYRDEMSRLAVVADAGLARSTTNVLSPGKLAYVVAGAFRGMTGEVVGEGTEGRFVIVLSVLGQRVPTGIPLEHLEAA